MKECLDTANLHRRLHKVIGQTQAIDRMVEDGVPCAEILIQLNAAKSALHRIGEIVLEGHLEHCVREGVQQGDAEKAIEDYTLAVRNFARMK